MPTYEYACAHCGHRFEKFQGMTEKPVQRCPECRHKVKRLLGMGAGIIFKGSGFYATDYRSEGYKKQAGKENSAGEKSEKKGGEKAAKETSGTADKTEKKGGKSGQGSAQ